MTDKMTREEAIKFLTLMRKAVSNFEEYGHDKASMVIECDKAEAIDIAIEALSIALSREDIIGYIDRVHNSGLGRNKALEYIRKYVERTESADAVSRYAEWLEEIIVDNEGANEWLCEDTPDLEWCEKNCHYSSIQAECLRHLYEVSKGERNEKRRSGTNPESSN